MNYVRYLVVLIAAFFLMIPAFSMPDDMRLALCVVFGEFEGNKFDWNSLGWVKQ